MKAENIIDSNLRRKSTIAKDFFAKIGFSKIFTYMLSKKKNFEHDFFQKNLYTTPLSHVFQLI